jgi:hypothetical protein
MAGKIGEEDRERMEAALVEALEWQEEQDSATGRTTKEDYEEKLGRWRCAAQSPSKWDDRNGGVAQDGHAAWRELSFW